jgi:hypothetical protein
MLPVVQSLGFETSAPWPWAFIRCDHVKSVGSFSMLQTDVCLAKTDCTIVAQNEIMVLHSKASVEEDKL